MMILASLTGHNKYNMNILICDLTYFNMNFKKYHQNNLLSLNFTVTLYAGFTVFRSITSATTPTTYILKPP